MPSVRFVVARTRWTPLVARFALRQFPNVTVATATPDKRSLFGVARVLLAPSLWPEAFGTVWKPTSGSGLTNLERLARSK